MPACAGQVPAGACGVDRFPRSPQTQPGMIPDNDRHAASRDAVERLHALVPGGAHTYAKGDDQYPAGMAPIIVRGAGCRVEDVDGNHYIEYGMGLRAVTLGHGFGPVIEAVTAQLANGVKLRQTGMDRARSRGGISRHRSTRGDGEVRQERVGRHDRRCPSCPRLHGATVGGDLCGATVFQYRRLVHRCDPNGRRHSRALSAT